MESKFSDTYIHVQWRVFVIIESAWNAWDGTMAPMRGRVILYFDKRRPKRKDVSYIFFHVENDKDNPLGIENNSTEPDIMIFGGEIWNEVIPPKMKETITHDIRKSYIRKRKKTPFIVDPSTATQRRVS